MQDALEWLRPFAGRIRDLSISSDAYHWSEQLSQQAHHAREAAEQLHIPIGIISIAQPETTSAASAFGQLPSGESAVMYRGRAAERLVGRAARQPWEQCEPGRVHVDPFGNLHLCQGIVVGNLFRTPLKEICETYDPDAHPIVGPLLDGGPAALMRRYALAHEETYADACHLCYASRRALRDRVQQLLGPDQMYGVPTPPSPG